MPEESVRLVHAAGECEIDLARRELRVLGSAVPVGGRAFEVIEVLARSVGETVTKNQLMDRIWPGAIVSDNTLQVHAGAIRKALGPYRSLLKTESGRGYRLLGNWTVRRQDAAVPPVGLQRMRVSARSPVTNFPAAASPLVGRTAVVPRLRDLISAYRVVTLTGPGGIGKTSLALKVARGIVGEFANGGWLVELASLSDPALVPSALAGVLELRLGAGQNSAEALARAVGDNNLLLLLDNCEHVIDAAAHLTETLVRLCPNVTILATSREILRVGGEYVYRVAPLEVPAADADEPDQVLSHSAVALFVARAMALNSEFSLHAGNMAEVGAICRHLDGIPLAIEFAAARAAVLGVQPVTAGLRDRFELLRAGRRTAQPRHRTLRAALDWSYGLLPEPEQRLLRCLSVFSGGFTFAGAAAVMKACGLDAEVADGVASLVAKSLVTLDRSETEPRWNLLETTRAYALEKLAESGESWQMSRYHAEFCLSLFAPFAAEGQLPAALHDLARYRCDIDNLRAALSWALISDGDAAIGVALAAAAADFWSAVSLDAEAWEWAARAVARIGSDVGTRREMVLQFSLGMTQIHTKGMIGGAREAMMRALTLARELANIDYRQRATNGLWLFSFRTAAFDDALAISRQYDADAGLQDPHSRAVADWLVGIPQIYLAEHAEASLRLQRAIDLYPIESRGLDTVRFGGDVRASASGHLAVSLLSLGRLDAASQAAHHAVDEARNSDQPAVLCVALAWAAGFIFLSLGELDMAARYGEELIAHAYKYGLRPIHATGLCVRASLAAKGADPDTGIDLLRRGLAGMREASYLLFYPFFLAELAATLGALGRVNDGITEIDTALSFAVTTGYRWYVPEILRVKGELLALRGSEDPAVIADLFRRSMRQAHEQQALYWELSAATSLAEFLRGQHRETEAHAVLAPVYDRFTEGYSVPKLRHARALLDRLS